MSAHDTPAAADVPVAQLLHGFALIDMVRQSNAKPLPVGPCPVGFVGQTQAAVPGEELAIADGELSSPLHHVRKPSQLSSADRALDIGHAVVGTFDDVALEDHA